MVDHEEFKKPAETGEPDDSEDQDEEALGRMESEGGGEVESAEEPRSPDRPPHTRPRQPRVGSKPR